MPDGSATLTLTLHQKIADVPAAEWDSCAGNDNPFVSHAFLSAMEDSGSANARTGWLPQHAVLRGEAVVARDLQPLARPDELAAEGGEGRAASLLALHQRGPKKSGPLLDEVPGMTVGDARARGGVRNLPGQADFIEQIDHYVDRLRLLIAPEAPDRLDFDSNHGEDP